MKRDIERLLRMLGNPRAKAIAEGYKTKGEILEMQGPVPFDVFLYFIRAGVRVRVI